MGSVVSVHFLRMWSPSTGVGGWLLAIFLLQVTMGTRASPVSELERQQEEKIHALERRLSYLEQASQPDNDILLIGGSSVMSRTNEARVLGKSGYDCRLPDLPEAVMSAEAVLHEGHPLVCGGMTGTGDRTSRNCYSLQGRSWVPKFTMNHGRQGHSMVSTNDGIMIFGGGHDGLTPSEVIPTGDEHFRDSPTIPPLGVLASCSVRVNKTHVVFIGGITGTQVILFNLLSKQWSRWPALPSPVLHHACIMTRDGILVSGGGPTEREVTSDTWLIDITTGRAELVGPMREARKGHKLVNLKGMILAVGGWAMPGNTFMSTDYVEEWISETKSWVVSSWLRFPISQGFFAAVSVPSSSPYCL